MAKKKEAAAAAPRIKSASDQKGFASVKRLIIKSWVNCAVGTTASVAMFFGIKDVVAIASAAVTGASITSVLSVLSNGKQD